MGALWSGPVVVFDNPPASKGGDGCGDGVGGVWELAEAGLDDELARQPPNDDNESRRAGVAMGLPWREPGVTINNLPASKGGDGCGDGVGGGDRLKRRWGWSYCRFRCRFRETAMVDGTSWSGCVYDCEPPRVLRPDLAM